MMIPLATQFCQNELAKKDLRAARDKAMNTMWLKEGRQRQAMKRPASSTLVDLTEGNDNNKEKGEGSAKVAKTSEVKASKQEKGQQNLFSVASSYEPIDAMPSSLFDSLS